MKSKSLILGLMLLLILFAVGAALADANAEYEIPWWTVDGGGGDSTGSGFSLTGTIGQADANQQLTSGDYVLQGGFWVGGAAAPPEHPLYLPLVLR